MTNQKFETAVASFNQTQTKAEAQAYAAGAAILVWQAMPRWMAAASAAQKFCIAFAFFAPCVLIMKVALGWF
jgi:hypothetical protein